jgi:hypothetical protein
MEQDHGNSASSDNPTHDEVLQLRKRVQELEQELAASRRALMLSAKEIFARQPLPYTEEELARMVAEQQGLPLEAFLGELEAADEGHKP